MYITIAASVGELVDKITILEIKAAKIRDDAKRRNVEAELRELSRSFEALGLGTAQILRLKAELSEVNSKLWDIEDRIRVMEREQRFDGEFIALARSVYLNNDLRARFKREINRESGSKLIEEKSYEEY